MTMANESFSDFFAETRHALLRYVRRLTRSGDTAEDIVQEAYARTYEQGEAVQAPKAFLFVTARNLVWNEQRHRRIAATDTVADIERGGAVDEANNSTEAGLIAEEAATVLREAIERLPPKCRAAFGFIHDEGEMCRCASRPGT